MRAVWWMVVLVVFGGAMNVQAGIANPPAKTLVDDVVYRADCLNASVWAKK